MRVAENILDLVGATPLLRLVPIEPDGGGEIPKRHRLAGSCGDFEQLKTLDERTGELGSGVLIVCLPPFQFFHIPYHKRPILSKIRRSCATEAERA